MGIKVPRYLIAVAACVLLGPAASAGVAATPRSVDPSTAAATCTPRAHAGGSTNPSIAKLNTLASCVLRAERKQLALGYAQNKALSGLLDGALKQLIALPYLNQHQSQLVQPAEQNAGDGIVKAFCKSSGPGVSRGGWEFANRVVPPAPSALRVASIVASLLQSPDAIGRVAGAKFGVAVRQGLLFKHGDRKGVSVGLIAVTCA